MSLSDCQQVKTRDSANCLMAGAPRPGNGLGVESGLLCPSLTGRLKLITCLQYAETGFRFLEHQMYRWTYRYGQNIQIDDVFIGMEYPVNVYWWTLQSGN